MIYFVSDTHFYHQNVIDFEKRPFKTVEQMNETIINNWNSVVGKDDTVYHLGDFGFGNKTKLIKIGEMLNGKKHLIVGNHDWKYTDTVLKRFGFCEITRSPFVLNDKYILTHRPQSEIKDGYINLFGHVHSNSNIKTVTDTHICLCVERWNYTPVSLESISKL